MTGQPSEGGTQALAVPDTALRYPLAPLMDAAGIATMAELRLSFPMGGTTYRQVIDEGLSEVQADRWAVRLGLHPTEVWPGFGLVPCLECGTLFAPRRAGHRFHTTACAKRRQARERYQNDPEYRARKLGQVKAHDDEVRRVKRLKAAARRVQHRERLRVEQRAYYAANADEIRAAERARYHANKPSKRDQRAAQRKVAA